MDKYSNFAHLITEEIEGVDYQIEVIEREGTLTAIIAPHGGAIEPGTSELCKAIAAENYQIGVFEGVKQNGNAILHITSTRFDEPKCLKLVSKSNHVLAIHGEQSAEEVVYMGGADSLLREKISEELIAADFRTEEHVNPSLQGTSSYNICNRGQRSKGVQLELSRGLRQTLFQSLSSAGRKSVTPGFYRFVQAVRRGLHNGGAN